METEMLFILLSLFLCFVHTERQFVFVNTPMDWTSAQTYCRQKYTDLVTVYDEQENQELIELAPNTNMNIWIGLHHRVNKWRWSLGEPPLSDNTYETIWYPGQPDNRNEGQHCVSISITTNKAGIFDRECHKLFSFICLDGNAPENFILVNTPKTWLEAQEYCRRNHDDLASVRDDGERQKLLDKLKSQSTDDAWIGLFRVPWTSWSDNTYTSFYNWETEPTFYKVDDHCASLSSATGKWHETFCSVTFPFFCYGDNIPETRRTVLKVKLQSTVDLNNMEIQQQILEQIKNRLGAVGEANVTVKWRTTTKTPNPEEPVTNQTEPIECIPQNFVN